MIKIAHRSILNATENIIVQQVNCMGVMGAGLAKSIYTKWPTVRSAYLDYCKRVGLGRALLGEVNWVKIQQGETNRGVGSQYVANCFSQYDYRRPTEINRVCHTDYSAMEKCFNEIAYKSLAISETGFSIAIPYGIGCGLAGGDWCRVYGIIQNVFRENMVTLYKLDKF